MVSSKRKTTVSKEEARIIEQVVNGNAAAFEALVESLPVAIVQLADSFARLS